MNLNFSNVGELRALIADLPDHAPVLMDNGDHGYHEVTTIWAKTALKQGEGRRVTWTEDIFTPEIMGQETEYGTRVAALCLA